MSGFIKLHRKILKNPLFIEKPMARHVFQTMLLMSAWDDSEQSWNGKPVSLRRGQVMISPRKLAKSTGLSYQNIRTILNQLVEFKIIKINAGTSTKPSMVTICKYSDYQDDQRKANARPNASPTQAQRSIKEEEEIEEERNPLTPLQGGPADPFGFVDQAVNDGVIQLADGTVQLVNGTRTAWLERFDGDAEQLDLALIEATASRQRNTRQPLKPQIERVLARKASDLKSRAKNYRDSKKPKLPKKITGRNISKDGYIIA